jgi:hypothetical protein
MRGFAMVFVRLWIRASYRSSSIGRENIIDDDKGMDYIGTSLEICFWLAIIDIRRDQYFTNEIRRKVMEQQKLTSAKELREAIRITPQLKLELAAMVSRMLREHNKRLIGPALATLNFCSDEELEKIGEQVSSKFFTTE